MVHPLTPASSDDSIDQNRISSIRELTLSTSDRAVKVARELWSNNNATYAAYRKYLRQVRDLGFPARQALDASDIGIDQSRDDHHWHAFNFTGVRCIFDSSKHSITLLSFAKLRSDLLAFGNAKGELWLAQPGDEAKAHKLRTVHHSAVTALDWSYDNSYLVSCSGEQHVALWHVPSRSCRRVLVMADGQQAHSCRFSALNPNVLLVGTSAGAIQQYNVNTGTLLHTTELPLTRDSLAVTALAISNTILFAGDSHGCVHLLHIVPSSASAAHMALQLHHSFKLHVACSARSAVTCLQYTPYCQEAHGPVLLSCHEDGTTSLLLVHPEGWLDLYCRSQQCPVARPIKAVLCPSVSHDSHCYLAMGSEQGHVVICDGRPAGAAAGLAASQPFAGISSLSHFTSALYIGSLGGAASVGKQPLAVVRSLVGHGAPVTDVSWNYDENLLASGDASGVVVVWRRMPQRAGTHSSCRGVSGGSSAYGLLPVSCHSDAPELE